MLLSWLCYCKWCNWLIQQAQGNFIIYYCTLNWNRRNSYTSCTTDVMQVDWHVCFYMEQRGLHKRERLRFTWCLDVTFRRGRQRRNQCNVLWSLILYHCTVYAGRGTKQWGWDHSRLHYKQRIDKMEFIWMYIVEPFVSTAESKSWTYRYQTGWLSSTCIESECKLVPLEALPLVESGTVFFKALFLRARRTEAS